MAFGGPTRTPTVSFLFRLQEFVYSLSGSGRALLTLGGAMVVGALATFMHAVSTPAFFVSASLGLAVAGASLLGGGTLGFLFGIPRSRSADLADSQKSEGNKQASGPAYRANTNLEDISDWLTKMLVGVGLIQVASISDTIQQVAAAIGTGMGGSSADEVFALALIVYFLIVGFLFGYLWARLFMAEALVTADLAAVRRVELIAHEALRTVTETREQVDLDGEAVSLATQQVNSSPNADRVDEDKLREAIRVASTNARRQIYELAWEVRSNNWRTAKGKMALTIPIFRALIDYSDRQYHTNYGQLGFALKDQQSPDWHGAEAALSRAIDLRGPWQRAKRWLFYEFNRAICRIELDEHYKKGQPCPQLYRKRVVADLAGAYSAGDIRQYLSDEPIAGWMALNRASEDELVNAT